MSLANPRRSKQSADLWQTRVLRVLQFPGVTMAENRITFSVWRTRTWRRLFGEETFHELEYMAVTELVPHGS